MGDIINFPSNRGKQGKKKVPYQLQYEIKLFEKVSKDLGVDLDKVLFEEDEVEIKKLEREMLKRTLKMWTEESNNKIED